MAENSSKRVENNVEKETLHVTSNFSCSHSVFKRLTLQKRKTKSLFFLKELNSLLDLIMFLCYHHSYDWLFRSLSQDHTIPHFDALKIFSCGKHCEKRRNCLCNKQFLLFSQCFRPYIVIIFHFICILTLYLICKFWALPI